MSRKNGFVLLGLVLFFSVLVLSSTVTVFEQDTRLKRFQEKDLKSNLDSIRRAIDLYRFKYSVTTPNSGLLAILEDKLKDPTGLASEVIQILANESFLRSRLASGTMRWKRIQNLVQNSSFELDVGTTDPTVYKVGTWRGNFSPNDDVPDGWELTANGAFQKIDLSSFAVPATFVVSFWARSTQTTAGVKLNIGPDAALPTLQLTANNPNWKRYYGVFVLNTAGICKLEFEQTSSTIGDVVYVDGIMLEEWTPPANAPVNLSPVPSVWTASFTIVPDIASETLQHRNFDDIITPDTTAASMSWWLEW